MAQANPVRISRVTDGGAVILLPRFRDHNAQVRHLVWRARLGCLPRTTVQRRQNGARSPGNIDLLRHIVADPVLIGPVNYCLLYCGARGIATLLYFGL
jgi:hypothetical protein